MLSFYFAILCHRIVEKRYKYMHFQCWNILCSLYTHTRYLYNNICRQTMYFLDETLILNSFKIYKQRTSSLKKCDFNYFYFFRLFNCWSKQMRIQTIAVVTYIRPHSATTPSWQCDLSIVTRCRFIFCSYYCV